MTAEQPVLRSPARRPRWRYFVQFSLRSLLLFMTAAAVACWWFLQPQIREEQFGTTPLRLRRQIRLVKVDPATPLPRPSQVEILNGQHFVVANAGHWRVFDASGNLLVDGRYENDEQHGKWTTYHSNGRRVAEGQMVRGVKVGPWRTWDEEGRLLSEVVFRGKAGLKEER